ncbi:hypothetical protein [Burkholderia sola]|uniref:hypothetical protein n=1 Tax=Burkholderia sola TaxID=2843302 RepID=UPI00338EE035
MDDHAHAWAYINAQAVQIPADLAYERSDIALEIKRVGDEIRIRPARRPRAWQPGAGRTQGWVIVHPTVMRDAERRP